MNNKQKAALKKFLKSHEEIKDLHTLFNVSDKESLAKNLDYFLNYVQEEIKDYNKLGPDFDGLIYTLDKAYTDVQHVIIDGLVINLEVIIREYNEFVKNY